MLSVVVFDFNLFGSPLWGAITFNACTMLESAELQQLVLFFPDDSYTAVPDVDDNTACHYLNLWLAFWIQFPEPVIGQAHADVLEDAWSSDYSF